MNIISTNILTKEQLSEIKDLTKDYTAIFLEADMNEYPEFPCFHLLYEEQNLVSFLSVFIPHEDECEIYAYTSQEHRRKGYFKRLYKIAKKHIDEYNIGSILIVTEPPNNVCPEALTWANAEFLNSDFMLRYSIYIVPVPKNVLTLKIKEKNQILIFETFLGEEKVGSCKVDNAYGSSTIYDFEVDTKFRGKGYGSETLLLIIKILLEKGYKNIILHINSENKIALSMYLKYGFLSINQIDYWKVI